MSASCCPGPEREACPTAGTRGAWLRQIGFGVTGVFSLMVSFAAVPDAMAENLLWTGTDGGEWSTGADWAPSRHVPTAADAVIINTFGPAITIGTNAEAAEVLIGTSAGTGTLVVRGSLKTTSFGLGTGTGSTGTATFSGASWVNDGAVSVGGIGTGELLLQHGTIASAKDILIGGVESGNGSVTLDNSSSLTSSGTVFVGTGGSAQPSGGNGSLNIRAASTLESKGGVLAGDAGTTGTALVSGNGSRWSNLSDGVVVGEVGVGTLTVTSGGTVVSQTMTIIGNLDSADGSSVTVSRRGSSLRSRDTLVVGNGGAATLRVEAAGTVTSGDAIIGRHSQGSATVTGEGSRWTTGDLQVGGDTADPNGPSGNGTLNVTAGSTVESTRARLGAVAGATGAAVVDGQGSTWAVGSGNIEVGSTGTGSLAVTGGGFVDAANIVIGANGGSTGTARVNGAGSRLQSRSDLKVGLDGDGSMTVEAGGVVTSRDGYVVTRGASSSSVTVTGDGSSWTMSGTFFVGEGSGTTGNVVVSASGDIRAASLRLADLAGSSGTLTITGAGSNVTAYVDNGIAGSATVGAGGNGSLAVTNGASFNAYDLYVGSGAGSTGGVVVSGDGSRAAVRNSLVAGLAGNGSIEVTGGASLVAQTILIAVNAGSTGALSIGAPSGQTARSAGAVDAGVIAIGAGNGSIVFNHSETNYDLSANIFGAGHVVAENGVTTLSGHNSYSGGTTISAGILKGTATSFGSGQIVNEAQLVVDGAGTFSNVVSGTGAFEKTGGGNLVMTGDSTYTGITEVSSGKLSVNGSLVSTVFVDDGATLGGSGTIGGLTVASGGTLSPGNSIGTLTSTGDVTFASGSVYAVEIDASGNSDRLDVNGTITIGNNVNLVVTTLSSHSAYSLGTRYTILTATGGVSGVFSSIDENFAYLIASVTKSTDSATAYLSFSRTSPEAGLLASATSTENAGAANAVEALGEAAPLYQAAVFLQQGEAQSAFSQLAGALQPSLAMALISRSQLTRDVILDRMRSAFNGIDARQILPIAGSGGRQPENIGEDHLTFWSSGFGARSRLGGDGHGFSVETRGGGVLFGVDGDLDNGWRTGLAAGYGHDTVSQIDLAASANVDSYYLAAYAGTAIGPTSLNFGAIHAFQNVETQRAISFSTLKGELAAGYDASTTQAFAEAAWRFDFDPTHVEPYANISYVNTHTDAFREIGGIAAVSSGPANHGQLYTTLGARISRDFAVEGGLGRAMFDVAWRHGYGDRTLESRLFYDGGSGFSVASAASARDAALLNIGLSYDLNPFATLTFRYGAVFGAGVLEQSAFAELGVRF